MRYNIVKDADEILKNSKYLIKNPSNYKNKWKTVIMITLFQIVTAYFC